MRFIGNLLRIYSYIFEAILSLAALAMSIVILASPHNEVRLAWLPWPEETLGAWLMATGLVGLAVVILAVLGQVRFPLTLFALAVFVVITRGLFFTSWRFNGGREFRIALWLVLALLIAFIGSIPMRRQIDAPDYRRPRGR